MSNRLTMKPGVSLLTTTVLPRLSPNRLAE